MRSESYTHHLKCHGKEGGGGGGRELNETIFQTAAYGVNGLSMLQVFSLLKR